MSDKREMKKITMETLAQAEHKVSVGKFKKAAVAFLVVLVAAGGSYAAYRLITGDLVASRFTVNNLTCPACVLTVKEVAGKIPGVVDSDVSLAGQAVTVTYREKQAKPEQIKDAIARAGYPIKLDGLFKPSGEGIDETVVALVNGRAVLGKQMKMPVNPDDSGVKDTDPATVFFSRVGKEIILQAADAKIVAPQPSEVEQDVEALRNRQQLSPDDFARHVAEKYGSMEKFLQVTAQRVAIRKLLAEHVLEGVQDPKEREHKTLEWVGTVFKDADVKILDPAFGDKLRAAGGQADWKKFWPLMISKNTELRSVLVQ